MILSCLLNVGVPLCGATNNELTQGPNVTPVPSGVVVTNKEEVRRVKAWSKVFVTLSQPLAQEPNFLQVLDWVEDHVHLRFDNRDFRTQKLGELLVYRAHGLRSLIHSSRRVKRAPLDIIGDIGSSLFGIARTSDVVAVAKVEQQLAGELEGVIEDQREVIARVNLIGRQQDEISKKVNFLIEYSKETFALLKTYWDKSQSRFEDNEAVQRMSEVLSILEHEIYAYLQTLEEGRRIRTLCETGTVNEDLLPIDIVRQIQKSRNNHNLVPIHRYYQYIKVTVMTFINHELMCVLSAPVLNEEEFIQYTIATFPVLKDQCYVRLYHDEKVIYGTYGGEMFFPRQCRGHDPIVCEAGVMYDKSQQPCLHGMLTGDLDQLRTCPITLSKTAGPAHRVQASNRNRFVVSTTAVEYHYRCAGSPPMQGSLAFGTYIIDVGPDCNFDASIWSLRGVPEDVIYYNVTLVQPKVIQPALYLIQNISQEWDKIELPPGIAELELPNMTVLHQAPHRSLVPETDNLVERLQSAPWWYYALGVCGIFVLFGSMYVIYLCRDRIRGGVQRKPQSRTVRVNRSEIEDHNAARTEVKIPLEAQASKAVEMNVNEDYEHVDSSSSNSELKTRECSTQV